MSMHKMQTCLNVLCRAGIAAFIEGVMGTGKTALVLNTWRHMAEEKNQLPEKYVGVNVSAVRTDLFRELPYNREHYWIWWASAANMLLEELVGYAHTQNPYKDADDLAWKVAGQMSSTTGELRSNYDDIKAMIFDERGITQNDRDRVTLRYLRSTKFLPPEDHAGGGVLFIDELPLGGNREINSLMSLVLEGRFLDYTLPPNIWCVTSANPAIGTYQSRDINPPMRDRFCQLKATTVIKETLDLFQDMGIHQAVIDLVTDKGEEVHNPEERESEWQIDVACNNRSLEFASRLLETMTPSELKDVGMLLLVGVVGDVAGADLYKSATAYRELVIRPSDVFESYGATVEGWRPESTTMKSWPETAVRGQVKRLVRQATARTDLLEPVYRASMLKLNEIHKDVVERCGRDRDKFTHNEKQQVATLNIIGFLCDSLTDRSRGFVFTEMQKEGNYDTTFGLYAKSNLLLDLRDHVKGKAMAEGVDVKKEDGDGQRRAAS